MLETDTVICNVADPISGLLTITFDKPTVLKRHISPYLDSMIYNVISPDGTKQKIKTCSDMHSTYGDASDITIDEELYLPIFAMRGCGHDVFSEHGIHSVSISVLLITEEHRTWVTSNNVEIMVLEPGDSNSKHISTPRLGQNILSPGGYPLFLLDSTGIVNTSDLYRIIVEYNWMGPIISPDNALAMNAIQKRINKYSVTRNTVSETGKLIYDYLAPILGNEVEGTEAKDKVKKVLLW
jgi:hypothetical protein